MRKTTLSLLSPYLHFGHIRHVYANDADFSFSVSGGSAEITGYTGVETDISIPAVLGGAPVTSLSMSTFKRKGITSVIFPDSITNIGGYAFQYNHLTAVDLPDNLKTIDWSVFENNLLNF